MKLTYWGRSAAILLLFVVFISAKKDTNGMVDFLFEYMELKYQNHQIDDVLYVATKRQRMYLIKDQKVVKRYKISTSKYGVGNELDSEKTPLGLHNIHAKFGEAVPFGGIFKNRQYVGRQAEIIKTAEDVEADDVTSRILWLDGQEQGVNRGQKGIDSRQRCIYIHGTPEEGLIGTPASHGCIRMKNADVIELYQQVDVGTYVIILDN